MCLKNRIYLGKLPNKSTGEIFDGLHPAIIDIELFDRVQQKLTEHNNHKCRPYTRGMPLLHQKIFTSDGHSRTVKAIATAAQRDRRTIYKYLNLAYLSPRIINDIMNNKIPSHINLQNLFQIASKYEDFEEQERMFYDQAIKSS